MDATPELDRLVAAGNALARRLKEGGREPGQPPLQHLLDEWEDVSVIRLDYMSPRSDEWVREVALQVAGAALAIAMRDNPEYVMPEQAAVEATDQVLLSCGVGDVQVMRVAKAILAADPGFHRSWEDCDGHLRDGYMRMARASLDAA